MNFSKTPIQIVVLFCLCIGFCTSINASHDNERKPYIVYMGALPEQSSSLTVTEHHHNLLSEAIGDESIARKVKIHSYGRSFNGFVARLLPHEARRLSEKESVVSVFENTVRMLRTTRSWDFLGMSEKTSKRNPKGESNVIVGLIDTGIWVDSPSFSDNKDLGPPPSKWKGKCEKGGNFTGCNNKVIGAQYYNLDQEADYPSPADTQGHGTHTASTAAGNYVKGASLYGIAEGTARGGVPSARIAVYKVCWNIGCSDMNLLAGFDSAIADGVDVISVSIGGPSREFFEDSIAIGAFHAMKKGIFVSCAAGNDGPQLYTVENVAPWITTVAASSLDRQIVNELEVGDNMKVKGVAINTFSPEKKMYPLTSGALAAKNNSDPYASSCDYGTLDENKVKGKIVYCSGGAYGQDFTILGYHGAGIIMIVDPKIEPSDTAASYIIPATVIPSADGKKIEQYITKTKTAQALIQKSKGVNMTAPFIASFSSRGPQMISHFILKPDLAAPGLSILAAYTQLTSMTGADQDKRFVKYNIMSGTSMATPHVSGAAAYVKSFHPTWSPAAIKSALMTTATPMKIKTKEAELATGSGQINPTKAIDPGLVYDLNTGAYVRFLCKEGYNSTTINLICGGKEHHDCSKLIARGTDGLNYPTMHLQLKNRNSSIAAVFERIVTNVGTGKAEYKVKVTSPKGLAVIVVPTTLTFDKPNQRRLFKVGLRGKFIEDKESMLSAMLEWRDSKHSVKSPIVIYRSLY